MFKGNGKCDKPVTPRHGGNPEMARVARELRRSSAASPHTPKTRKGTRGMRKSHAIACSIKDMV